MNRLSNAFQFILGFFLGVLLLVAGTAAVGFVFFSRLASPPDKPTFTEEKINPNQVTQEKESTKSESVRSEQEKEKEPPTPTASPENKSEEKKQESKQEKEKLPAGAYKAKVNWSTGLSLRSEPSKEAERVGGVDYNTELIILEKSSDGNWEKVRVTGTNQEGWIKAGNVEKSGE
jgi:hypothetical protein